MRNFILRRASEFGAGSDCGTGCPRARSSRVTVMVEATVLVRKLRRLQPASSCVEDVMSSMLFGCEEIRDLGGPASCGPETKERPHAFGSSYRDINSA